MHGSVVSDTPHSQGHLRPGRSQPFLSRRARLTVLTAHIIISVGLLGDSAGFLAVAIRTAMTDDPRTVFELVDVLNMFSLVFGIPLSIGVLITGVVLGLGTRWGVLRYPWVTAKLLLILSVMVVGGTFIGPAETALREGPNDAASFQLMAAASYDVLALALATALGVFKPGGPFHRAV
jgi:Predicted integral membrane protein (DUF2269)